ncbi:hypothetical protein HMPREF0494_0715 [Limosilactobacillus antri DSM 16041]|uniref:Uncharacterized protein n=1 Tax=Limosilactobacillus antri DSM 16041 TaxID=525309 RepID=C8P5X1_9LACO|nr:hypothetical protein HMPREF0494_0715 [Limosilactobacillus antri DSM 16041]KRK60259.1 hypothetical protein FC31_GL001870 [Limosilactobacillus antri DSM 16041]
MNEFAKVVTQANHHRDNLKLPGNGLSKRVRYLNGKPGTGPPEMVIWGFTVKMLEHTSPCSRPNK